MEEDVGEKRNPKHKKKKKFLAPSGGILNLICGVNISIEEAGDMAELVLVGNIRGRNPDQEEMELWV